MTDLPTWLRVQANNAPSEYDAERLRQAAAEIEQSRRIIAALDEPSTEPWVLTQRRFERAAMIATIAVSISLIAVAWRHLGVDLITWSVWFAVMLMCIVAAGGGWVLYARYKRWKRGRL